MFNGSIYYNMFNQDYMRQMAQQHHLEQTVYVIDSARKLKDFLDSTDKIEPQYIGAAFNEFLAIIAAHNNSRMH